MAKQLINNYASLNSSKNFTTQQWLHYMQSTGISVTKSKPAVNRVASKKQIWTRDRNWLKRSIIGNLARIQGMLFRYKHCLSDEEQQEMDDILDLMKALNDKWRQRQADMVVLIK